MISYLTINSITMNKNIVNQFAKMIVLEYAPFEKIISSVTINNISNELERIFINYTSDEYIRTIFYKYNRIIGLVDYEDDDEQEIIDAIDNITMNIYKLLFDSDSNNYDDYKFVINNIRNIPLDIYRCLELASFNYFKNNKHFHPLAILQSVSNINYITINYLDKEKKNTTSRRKFDHNGNQKEVDTSLTFEEIKESLENGDEVHFYVEDSTCVLVKDNDRFEEIWFDIWTFHHFINLVINDKDSDFMGKIIPYATYKMINNLPDNHRNKVIKYIEMVNNRNTLIFSKNKNKPLQDDVIKYVINKYVNPEIDLMTIKNELHINASNILEEVNKKMEIECYNIIGLNFDNDTKKLIQGNVKYLIDNLDNMSDIFRKYKPSFSNMKKINKMKIITYLLEYLQYPLCKRWINEHANFKKVFINKIQEFKNEFSSNKDDIIDEDEKNFINLLEKISL